MSTGARLRPGCPPGLARALAERGAEVVAVERHHTRVHIRAQSGDGPLFARVGTTPADAGALEHEVAVRALVGSTGPLRSPPILASGRGWTVEPLLASDPVAGARIVDALVAAAGALASLSLPAAPARVRAEPRRRAWRRRLRVARSPLTARDVLRARRILAAPGLPDVTSHGDFHAGNVLVAEGVPWVIDWELCGRRAAGFDLMQLWATLPDASDRERAFAGVLALVGHEHERALLALRYAVVVGTISGILGSEPDLRRGLEESAGLVALLPALRGDGP